MKLLITSFFDEGAAVTPTYKETPKFSYQGESTFDKTFATKSTEAVVKEPAVH